MEEKAETLHHATKKHRKGRRRRVHRKTAKPHVSVSVGSVYLCTQNHETSISTNNSADQTTIVEVRSENLLLQNKPYLDVEESEDEDLVEVFMTNDSNRPRPLYQAESVKTFCRSEAVRELVLHGSRLPSRRMCLVDDMTNAGSGSSRLGDYRPLTAWEMYHKLKNNRFHPTTPTGLPAKHNVDRRLIFTADPDKYALAAIVATAPGSQNVPLIDFFYHYVSFRSQIRFATKPPRGYENFAQQFHLPFYSWQCAGQEPRDHRRKVNGSLFRKVSSMHFIRGKVSEPVYEVDYLCEGQLSVLIAAINRRIWTGYCFVDTYYQPESRRSTVKSYCKDDSDPDDLQTDPFINGECDADNPIPDAVEYFLTALDSQLGVFRNEWSNTVFHISKRVEEYIAKFPYSSLESQSSLSKEAQESSIWLRLTRDTLTKLITCLETTIRCWDNRSAKEQPSTNYEDRCLGAILSTISDLRDRLFELQNVLRRCGEHERALNLDNIDAQKQISELQTTSTLSNQTATNILLHIISPITVAAAMLSMQEKAIPSILGPNKLSFFVLAPILIMVAAAMARITHSWDRILPALTGWMKRQEVGRRLARDIELVAVNC